MEAFRSTLEACQLWDLGFKGPEFTWCNMRSDGQFIRERLDRVLANEEWSRRYPIRQVEVLATICSDHNPVDIYFQEHKGRPHTHHRKFKFDAEWGKNEKAREVVKKIDLGSIKKLQADVDDILERDELKWRQLAKEHWLKLGDKNSKYFYARVKQRQKASKIQCISNGEGRWHTSPEAVQTAFIEHFKNIFTMSQPVGISQCLEALRRTVSEEMNEGLL
ncbi:uncharacterized protein LOC132182067 [Corylus avellana]|uniref:uncharacterized protein LOC132182067 n=1 Tax=Corylus avellana TaxID=13451 RepID=UPI00286CA34E|nr:uncharacterized protein LOC132182067 [Corylus avellana]